MFSRLFTVSVLATLVASLPYPAYGPEAPSAPAPPPGPGVPSGPSVGPYPKVPDAPVIPKVPEFVPKVPSGPSPGTGPAPGTGPLQGTGPWQTGPSPGSGPAHGTGPLQGSGPGQPEGSDSGASHSTTKVRPTRRIPLKVRLGHVSTFSPSQSECGTFDDNDKVAAIATDEFYDLGCGQSITVTQGKNSVNVRIVEPCTDCEGFDVKLSASAFAALNGDASDPVTWLLN